jgi:hypothetical protein
LVFGDDPSRVLKIIQPFDKYFICSLQGKYIKVERIFMIYIEQTAGEVFGSDWWSERTKTEFVHLHFNF